MAIQARLSASARWGCTSRAYSRARSPPVQQATKFEFILNFRTAKALGLSVPLSLLGLADEAIE